MRIAICDDNAAMRDHYAELVKLLCVKSELTVSVDRYEKSEQLLFALSDKTIPYDIALLDVLMPETDGINLGVQMRKLGFVGSIIYITRSKEHMLSAFDVGATNYILKGTEFDSDRFEKVFLKAAREVEQKKRKYILLNGISEHRNVALDSIRYFEVNKHICKVHYGSGETFEFVSTLGKIENTLLPFGFVRVHKSFLVNSFYVKSYTYKNLILIEGVQIPVGRKYSGEFRQTMEAFAEINVGSTDKERMSA